MPLNKQTTVNFPPELYAHLKKVAEERQVHVSVLIRTACEKEYGAPTADDRTAAVERMRRRRMPSGSVPRLKKRYVKGFKELPG